MNDSWACGFEDPIVYNMKALIQEKKYMNREIQSISRNFDRLDLKLYSLNENISCFEK